MKNKINLFDFIVDNSDKILYIDDDAIRYDRLMLIRTDNQVIVEMDDWFHIGEHYTFNATYTKEACYHIVDIINTINMVLNAVNGDYNMYLLRYRMTPVCITHESDLSTALELSLNCGGYLPVIVTASEFLRNDLEDIDKYCNIKECFNHNTYYPSAHLGLNCYSEETEYYEILSSMFLVNDNIED